LDVAVATNFVGQIQTQSTQLGWWVMEKQKIGSVDSLVQDSEGKYRYFGGMPKFPYNT